MESTRLFFLFLHKFIELNEREYNDLIRPYIRIRFFTKKQAISKPGEVENYLNYVIKGLVRKYYKKGKIEITTQLATEGHIIHAQESFHSRTISEYYIHAIEDTTLVSISYDDLEKAYATHPKLERLGRLVTTFSMVLKDKWQMKLVRLSPRERFLDFIHTYPTLVQRVPQKYLASYLNIQPETFSRFKHLLKTKTV